MRKKTKYLLSVPLSGSPETLESFCLTETYEVAEFSSEKLLKFGKFWIYNT